MIAKPPGRIYHRRGAPIFWAYLREPRRTFPGDAGDVGDIAGRFPAGVRNGGCAYASGPRARCLAFDGSTGYVQTGLKLAPAPAFSVAAGFIKTAAGVSTLAAEGDSGSTDLTFYFRINSTSGFTTGTTTYQNVTVPDCSLNVPHVAHLTYDGITLKYYLDGLLVASAAVSGTPEPSVASGVVIGQLGDNPTQYWPGSIDFLAIYDRALAPAEVRRDYADPFWRLRLPPRRAYLVPTPTPTPTAYPAALLACL